MKLKIINRGTGAGGKNTNLNGLTFEGKTDLTNFLVKKDYSLKDNYCFSPDKNIIFCKQNNFKKYILDNYKIKLSRKPDGAIVNLKTKEIFILEMKNQNVEGSVDLKLYAGIGIKREYEKLLPDFKIKYCFILNDWYKKEKYSTMKEILYEFGIKIYYGDDKDFFEKFYQNLEEKSVKIEL